MEELLTLEKRFASRRRVKIAVPGRQLIKYAVMTKVTKGFDKTYLFHLFSDLLTYSEESALGLKLHRAISLFDIDDSKIEDVPPKLKDKPAFKIASSEKSFFVCTKKPEERDAWVTAIKHAIDKLPADKKRRHDAGDEKNSGATNCTLCNVEYGDPERIKFCSLCAVEVCDMCSQGRKFIPQLDKTRPVLLCDLCMQEDDNLLAEVEDDMVGTVKKRKQKTRAATMRLKVTKGMTTSSLVDELLRNEKLYIETLEILLEAYVRPLLEIATAKNRKEKISELITGELAIFFTNIEQMTTLNKEFASTLEKRANAGGLICEVFKQYAPLFKLYAQFGKFLEKAKKSFRQREELQNYMKRAEEDARAQGQDFFSLLQYPLERVKNYEKFLIEYGDSLPEESEEWAEYRSSLEGVQQCNEVIKDAIEEVKSLFELEELEKKFTEPLDLTSHARRLVKEGLLFKFSRKGETRRYMFHLFTDMLIYSKPTKKGFEVHQILKVKEMNVKDVVNTSNVVNAWAIQTASKSFIVYADSPMDKEKWVEALCGVIENYANNAVASPTIGRESGATVIQRSHTLKRFKSRESSSDLSNASVSPIPSSPVTTRHRTSSSWWENKEEVVVNSQEAPVLVFANLVDKCKLCENQFNWRLVRRHCKMCGEVVCPNCSSNKILIPKVDPKKKQRICDKCHCEITEKDEDTLEVLPEGNPNEAEDNAYDSEDQSRTASYDKSPAMKSGHRLSRAISKGRMYE
eukprot:TRINITY_DN8505_c0_g1_i1.p1 TRINITY_DN8505_c0_g1~~TRINITY_DN8505_c0_g1_i1.p1  ORF type:complete len:835 (+),score=224.09 TRINITY_DN8505_c0_g1_i1:274-2505(+)